MSFFFLFNNIFPDATYEEKIHRTYWRYKDNLDVDTSYKDNLDVDTTYKDNLDVDTSYKDNLDVDTSYKDNLKEYSSLVLHVSLATWIV